MDAAGGGVHGHGCRGGGGADSLAGAGGAGAGVGGGAADGAVCGERIAGDGPVLDHDDVLPAGGVIADGGIWPCVLVAAVLFFAVGGAGAGADVGGGAADGAV